MPRAASLRCSRRSTVRRPAPGPLPCSCRPTARVLPTPGRPPSPTTAPTRSWSSCGTQGRQHPFQGSLISAAFVVAVLATVNSITVNRASPFTPDGVTSVTWTADATGGVAPLQYAFFRTKAGPGAAPC